MPQESERPEERPELGFVSAEETLERRAPDVVWWSGLNEETVGCSEFEYGRGRLDPGGSSPIVPENQFSGTDTESAAVVTSGDAVVTIDGDEATLTSYDALYVPPGGEYTFENRGTKPAEFVWCVAGETDAAVEGVPFDHGGVPQVVETLRDVDPVVTVREGHRKRFWFAVSPATVGSRAFNVTVIKRPPGSVAPLHEHEPPTRTEGFTVTEGAMLTTDRDGREYYLEPGDFLYIPPYGMHENKNVHTDDIAYVCLGFPGRTSDVTSSIEDTWYEDDG